MRPKPTTISTEALRLEGVAQSSSLSGNEFTSAVRTLDSREIVVVRGSARQRIAAIAGRQRGRVARRQLLALGLSSSAIQRQATAGALIRRLPGVYAVGHAAHAELVHETEALLACRPGAVLSHHSAAALWRMRPAPQDADPVDVVVPLSEGTRRAGIRCHRTSSLNPSDARVHRGLPVTSPARTLLDIAPYVTVRELEWAVDEALGSQIVRLTQIHAVLQQTGEVSGKPILRRLLAHRSGPAPTRSNLEKRFLVLLRSADLPTPETNIWLYGFLVDAYWPTQRVAFEIDSHHYHSSKSAFERDRRKEAVLKSHGLDFNRLSDHQIDHQPLAAVAFVAQRLARADAAS